VILDGEDIHSLPTNAVAQKMGLLSQENDSPGQLQVENLVYYGRYPHRGFFEGISAEDVEMVERALSLTGIEHLRDRPIESLSGGQKQLAWVAMILAQDTDVLLLDEPTTFLDLHHQLEVMEIIEQLNELRDVTIVVVLHDINQAARYAEHMIALSDGEIHSSGAPSELVTEQLLAAVFEVEATVTNDPVFDGPRVRAISPINRHQ
jgi:iron complex transport system ATP-binding protein